MIIYNNNPYPDLNSLYRVARENCKLGLYEESSGMFLVLFDREFSFDPDGLFFAFIAACKFSLTNSNKQFKSPSEIIEYHLSKIYHLSNFPSIKVKLSSNLLDIVGKGALIVKVEKDLLTVVINESCFFSSELMGWIYYGRAITCLYQVCLNFHANPNIAGIAIFSLGDDDFKLKGSLAFCSNTEGVFLIPDSAYIMADSYKSQLSNFHDNWIPFENRKSIVYWRGASTGLEPNPDERARIKLAKYCLDIDHFDVKITIPAQLSEQSEKELRASPIFSKHEPLLENLKYKYLIDIDGNTNAWASCYLKLCSGSVVLKVDSKDNWKQWYYSFLEPWKSFVPVMHDFSDLQKAYSILEKDPELAATIAKNAYSFFASDKFREWTFNYSIDSICKALNHDENFNIYNKINFVECTHNSLNKKEIYMKNDYSVEKIATLEKDGSEIEFTVRNARTDYEQLVKKALEQAINKEGKIDNDVLAIEGMSGIKYRYFINNLVGLISNPNYLEVGSWQGSTFCSAIYKNKCNAVAIDNWSLFGGPSNSFFHNLSLFSNKESSISFFNSDFRDVQYKNLSKDKFNIYLFDGPHEYQDQYDGLALALDALDDKFVFIVDDWNWKEVREGTLAAIEQNNLNIICCYEIRTTLDNSHPVICQKHSDWHNGYFISILSKK